MRFRNLDKNGDWTFGKGKNNYLSRDAAIALNIKTRILSFLGDCFFAQNEGIDWFNRVGRLGQQALLENDIRTTILQTPDVVALNSFSVSIVDRKATFSYDIKTIYSPSVQGEIERSL